MSRLAAHWVQKIEADAAACEYRIRDTSPESQPDIVSTPQKSGNNNSHSADSSEGSPEQRSSQRDESPRRAATKKLPVKKRDLSDYLDPAKLTGRQRECISLRLEYGLNVSEIAQRLRIDRKTVDEHIAAAQKKIELASMTEKRARNTAKSGRI